MARTPFGSLYQEYVTNRDVKFIRNKIPPKPFAALSWFGIIDHLRMIMSYLTEVTAS